MGDTACENLIGCDIDSATMTLMANGMLAPAGVMLNGFNTYMNGLKLANTSRFATTSLSVAQESLNFSADLFGINPISASNDTVLKSGLSWNEFQKATSGYGLNRKQAAEIYNSFEKGTISEVLAGNESFMYRYWGGNAVEVGKFAFPPSMVGAGRDTLALPEVWNDMSHLTKFQKTPNSIYFQGIIAPQFKFGPEFVGGGIQTVTFDLATLEKIEQIK